MPNESTVPEPKGKPVILRTLVPIDWALWGILVILALYGLVKVSTEGRGSPEAGPGLGIFTVLLLLALLAAAGFALRAAARRESIAGVITMTVILAWPCVFLVADPAMKAYKRRKYANAELDVGLSPLAQAIGRKDTAALARLLDAGADPNQVDPKSGNTPLGDVNKDPEMVRILVDHGADIDRIQPDGTTPVVRFIGTRQWESAVYLIEKGANLDVVNKYGVSVDYYLNEWKESVFGEHPQGWDQVRAAIAKRRAAPK